MHAAHTTKAKAASFRGAAFADKKFWKTHLANQRKMAEHAEMHRLSLMKTPVGRAHLKRVEMAHKRAEAAHRAAAEKLANRLPTVRKTHRQILSAKE